MGSFLFYAGCIGFAVGVALHPFLFFDYYTLGCFVCVGIALLILGRKRSGTSFAPFVVIFSVFLIFLSFGFARMEYAVSRVHIEAFETQLEKRVVLEGVVSREVEYKEKSSHVYLTNEDGTILLFASPFTTVAYGDKIRAKGVLQKPEPFETELGRTFNYTEYLHARGVSYTIPFAEIEVVAHDEGNPLIAALLQFKHALMENIRHAIPQPQAGLGEGLLLGVKNALGEELEEAFRTTGITHIVVLSGYNVMLVVLFVMYVLSFLLPLRMRLLCGMIAIVCFALMVGLSATVVRACIMATLLLLAQTLGRTYAIVRALCVAGLLMIVINPYLLLYDVGFQLSFVATLGLILLSPLLEMYARFMPKALGLREFFVATLATQICVAPILLYQIGELSLIALVVNVMVLPMVPLAMLLTFTSGMIGFIFAPLSVYVGYLASLSLSYIIIVAERFAQVPFASFTLPPFPAWYLFLAYCCLGVGVYAFVQTKKNTHQGRLVGWTIVDEEEFKKSLHKDAKAEPVFFR